MHIEHLTDDNSQIFVDMMEALGQQQHVNQPTHKKRNILDLIFTEVTSKINLRELEILNFMPDHWLISATIDAKKDLIRITKNQKHQRSDLATLMDNFQQLELNQNTDVSEAYEKFNLKLQEMIERCALKIVKRTEKPPKLWFNLTLCEQQKIVKNRERTWKEYK